MLHILLNVIQVICAFIDPQVQEHDTNRDGVNDVLDFKFRLIVPADHTIASLIVILALDFQLQVLYLI